MTTQNAEGLWNLVLCRYSGNAHILKHVNEASMRRRAVMENEIIEQLGLEHFGLQEALEKIRLYVEGRADFPP